MRTRLPLFALLLALLALAAPSARAAGTLTPNYPAIVPAATGTVTQTVTFVNPSAAYTTSPPVLTSSTGPAGFAVSAPAVVNNTTFTAVVTTGTAVGNITVTDTTTATSANLNVQWTNQPGANWTVEQAINFSSYPVSAGTVAAGGTIAGGLLTDEQGGDWFIAGGTVVSIPIASGGAGYASAPTVVISAPTASPNINNVQAAAAAVLTGGVVTSITFTNTGRGYTAAPTVSLSGGTPTTAATLGTPVVTGNDLAASAAVRNNGSGGYQGELDRPLAVNTLASRGAIEFVFGASIDVDTVALRINPATTSWYGVYATSAGSTTIIWNNNYGQTGGTQAFIGNGAGLTPLVIGHKYKVEGEAVPVSAGTTTTVRGTVIDEGAYPFTGNTVVSSGVATADAHAGVQTAGQTGLGAAGVREHLDSFTSYVGPGISVSNGTQPLSTTTTLNIVGIGTSFTTNAPSFTGSGLPSAALGAVAVQDNTHATIAFTSGNASGTLTITDATSGYSALVNVQAMAVPAAVVTAQGVLAATVAAPGGAAQGSSPYTYQLLRDVTSLSQAGVPVGAAQSGLAAGAAPSPVTDAPGTGFYYYRWRVTDAGGQVGYSLPATALVTDRSIYVLALGDSKTAGLANSSENSQWCLSPTINGSTPTGYPASSNFPLTISAPTGANGIQAAGYATSNASGVIVSCTITQRGWGYVAVPTVTLAQATTGTAAVLGGNAGGGWPLHAERMLRTLGGMHSVTFVNGAQGGTTSGLYNPAIAGYGTQASGVATAEYVSGQTDLTGWVVEIAAGVNETATSTKATYKANLQAAITFYRSLNAAWILLDKPDNAVPNTLTTFANTDAILGFGDACTELAAANPTFVRVGDTQSNAYFSTYQGTAVFGPNLGTNLTTSSVDLLHRNDFGQIDKAAMSVRAIGAALGLTGTASVIAVPTRAPSRGR